MGMAIMLVVLYHQDWFTVNIWGYIKQFGYLGVEIFLLVSGYGIVHSLQRNTFKKFYGNRVLRLLPACITYGIMKLIISQFIPFPQSGLCFIWDLLSITHWYIYAIILY